MLKPEMLGVIQNSLQSADLSVLESFELLREIAELDGTPRQTTSHVHGVSGAL